MIDVDLPGMDVVAHLQCLRVQGLRVPAIAMMGKPVTVV